ncbi:hypothetical protein JTB14_022433 [Gonioctena quinquepunctata]|nr:hypothetical protein JTB14_022433 [Gonioctena quinquepunctata]
MIAFYELNHLLRGERPLSATVIVTFKKYYHSRFGFMSVRLITQQIARLEVQHYIPYGSRGPRLCPPQSFWLENPVSTPAEVSHEEKQICVVSQVFLEYLETLMEKCSSLERIIGIMARCL